MEGFIGMDSRRYYCKHPKHRDRTTNRFVKNFACDFMLCPRGRECYNARHAYVRCEFRTLEKPEK